MKAFFMLADTHPQIRVQDLHGDLLAERALLFNKKFRNALMGILFMKFRSFSKTEPFVRPLCPFLTINRHVHC